LVPGGYSNDGGGNLLQYGFFGNKQPETQALFDLAERERPDLMINMHTGATHMFLIRPFCEPVLSPAFDSLYRYVHRRLTMENLRATQDVEAVDPAQATVGGYNLDTALNLHSGALSVTVESPSHAFDRISGGVAVLHTPEMLLDAQLFCHLEAIRFLAETGGRSKWTPSRR